MVASVNDFVRNILIYKILLLTFWLAAFLVPWLWLALVFMLNLLEVLTGKELNFGDRRKGIH
jgi:hypothetical protein